MQLSFKFKTKGIILAPANLRISFRSFLQEISL
jgi:hypothetical protein